MALTTAPYLVGVASQTSEWRFGGFLIGVEDSNSYLAKMGQGARGHWLFTPVYSSEPGPGVLLYLFYILLGKISGPDPVAELVVFHAARLTFGIGLLLVTYRFLAEFLPFMGQRRIGLALVAVGGGLGWLLVLLGQQNLVGSLPLDFFSPEAYTFITLYSLPHLAASRSLLLLGVLAYLRGRPVLAGLAWLGVSLIQPIHVIALWAVVAADTALSWRGQWDRALTAIGLSSPVVLYTVAVFSLNPVLNNWNIQSNLPSPHPLHYLLARLARWLAAWLIVVPILVYVPAPIQRRLVEGYQLPLVVLAVWGLTVGLRRARPWLAPLTLGASSLTALFLVAGGLVVARNPASPIFHAADQLAVFSWVAARADDRGVGLGAYATGNLIPAYTPLVAYLGLTTETASFAEKRERVAAFYRPNTSDAERQELLAGGRVRYVFFGPAERGLGVFDPQAAPYLTWAYASGDYAIYEVTP
jgi:hypothetical protein